MTVTLLDLSKTTELRWLGELTQHIQLAADALPFFIAGATARDLILQHGFGIDTGRKTLDVDFAVQVETWVAFEQVKTRLVSTGEFTKVPRITQRLRFGKIIIDLFPFGAIERPDRTIAWPPDGSTIMNVIGFHEALAATIPVTLPGGTTVRVVNLSGLALLKLSAWADRRRTQPGKDAYDLTLVLCNYLDAGNRERLYSDAANLLEEGDFDYEMAGAWLLGRDISSLLAAEGKERISVMLEREANPNGPLNLVGDMPGETEHALLLIRALKRGFMEK
ncbi:MAG: nucleotidyl transferase AbiEii/AbiGii toxin family protein [Sulfuricaulis sp.]|nr:nucleotidyl transferase AbiEii/AbiGii toxin family protein [Sulfuricaulis sp.]